MAVNFGYNPIHAPDVSTYSNVFANVGREAAERERFKLKIASDKASALARAEQNKADAKYRADALAQQALLAKNRLDFDKTNVADRNRIQKAALDKKLQDEENRRNAIATTAIDPETNIVEKDYLTQEQFMNDYDSAYNAEKTANYNTAMQDDLVTPFIEESPMKRFGVTAGEPIGDVVESGVVQRSLADELASGQAGVTMGNRIDKLNPNDIDQMSLSKDEYTRMAKEEELQIKEADYKAKLDAALKVNDGLKLYSDLQNSVGKQLANERKALKSSYEPNKDTLASIKGDYTDTNKMLEKLASRSTKSTNSSNSSSNRTTKVPLSEEFKTMKAKHGNVEAALLNDFNNIGADAEPQAKAYNDTLKFFGFNEQERFDKLMAMKATSFIKDKMTSAFLSTEDPVVQDFYNKFLNAKTDEARKNIMKNPDNQKIANAMKGIRTNTNNGRLTDTQILANQKIARLERDKDIAEEYGSKKKEARQRNSKILRTRLARVPKPPKPDTTTTTKEVVTPREVVDPITQQPAVVEEVERVKLPPPEKTQKELATANEIYANTEEYINQRIAKLQPEEGDSPIVIEEKSKLIKKEQDKLNQSAKSFNERSRRVARKRLDSINKEVVKVSTPEEAEKLLTEAQRLYSVTGSDVRLGLKRLEIMVAKRLKEVQTKEARGNLQRLLDN